jgi:TatA/E family protein of Tat protein translocase
MAIVFLFILESLGSTELLFILVMALVFFGPRKLPQISRSLGKSLAEFRRASDDFKRTWEREVAMESGRSNSFSAANTEGNANAAEEALLEPRVEALPGDHSIARDLKRRDDQASQPQPDLNVSNPDEPLPKRDWL